VDVLTHVEVDAVDERSQGERLSFRRRLKWAGGARSWWVLAASVTVALAGCFAVLAEVRPSYDAMGWMVWGHQVLHWNLNTDGAPSWKPLTFLFTLPYALAGHQGQLWLWTITAVTGAVASILLAARLVFRLAPGPSWARGVGAVFAAGGVFSLATFLHQTMIANSDPLIVALGLGAIELHLSRRYRGALALVWLAGLGRPEFWVFLLLYGGWLAARRRAQWWLVLAGLITTPAAWFVIPGLTSKSWFRAGDLALGQATAIHGNKLVGVFDRLRELTGTPMQIAVAVAIVVVLWKNRRAAWLVGVALVWVAVEIGFALHGWSAVQRYLLEPGAVLAVVAGAGIATVLGMRGPVRWAAAVAVLALAGLLVPFGRDTLRTDHGVLDQARVSALALKRLSAVIDADGGPRAIRSCGQPIGYLGAQSTLAWYLDMNVGPVGFRPGAAIDSGEPIVFFKLHEDGWIVHATHPAPAAAARCARLDRSTAFSPPA
jgi:hypothetical protein